MTIPTIAVPTVMVTMTISVLAVLVIRAAE